MRNAHAELFGRLLILANSNHTISTHE